MSIDTVIILVNVVGRGVWHVVVDRQGVRQEKYEVVTIVELLDCPELSYLLTLPPHLVCAVGSLYRDCSWRNRSVA